MVVPRRDPGSEGVEDGVAEALLPIDQAGGETPAVVVDGGQADAPVDAPAPEDAPAGEVQIDSGSID